MTDEFAWNAARVAIGVVIGFAIGCVGCFRHGNKWRAEATRCRAEIDRRDDKFASLDGWRVDVEMRGHRCALTKVERWADAHEVSE